MQISPIRDGWGGVVPPPTIRGGSVNAKRDPVRPEAMRSWCVQKQSIGPKHSDERKERRDRTETLMAIEELGE